MCLFEMVDFADMFGGMGELESYALAVPAGWKAPALDHGHLVRHVGVRGIVGDCVDSGLRHDIAGPEFLRHGWPPKENLSTTFETEFKPRSAPPATARSGTGRKAGTALRSSPRGAEPVETRRGLPGDADDTHSRYIEAAIGGLIAACLYLPNGNPAPGPKFEYKLRWFERLTSYAKSLLDSGVPTVLAGDFNLIPTDLDVYAPERWLDDALFRPEVRDVYQRLVAQGWTDALRVLHPDERIYTFWKYFRNAFARDAGLRIDHLLLSPSLAGHLVAASVDRDVRGPPRKVERSRAGVD
jgi:exodeoxyribonuclease III